ncbi:MAG: hypothetical protein QM673_15825 [Gordonia sp. (in: high G+C Gram-positive bacteria)]
MIVWFNGAFGAGKTHTAFELARRLENAHIADPELVGYGIHKVLPAAARTDFQDRPQCRSAVIATLAAVGTVGEAAHPQWALAWSARRSARNLGYGSDRPVRQ